mgnify:CR=1 FL=1
MQDYGGYFKYAKQYFGQKKFEKALEYINYALQYAPNDKEIIQYKRLIEEYCKEGIITTSTGIVDYGGYYKYAKEYYDKGQYEKALEYINYALEHYSASGTFIQFKKEIEEKLYGSATTLKNTNISNADYGGYFKLAEQYYNQGKFEDALEYINQALEHNPTNSTYLEFKEEVESLIYLAPAHEQIVNRNYVSALNMLNEYMYNHKSSFIAEALFLRGECYYYLEDYEHSLDDLNIFLQTGLDHRALYFRINIYIKYHRYYDAIKDCDSFFNLFKISSEEDKITYARVKFFKSWANAEMGYYNEALEDVNLAIKYRPDYEVAYYHRAMCSINIHKPKYMATKDFITAYFLKILNNENLDTIKILLDANYSSDEIEEISLIAHNIAEAVENNIITVDEVLKKIYHKKMNEESFKNYFLNDLLKSKTDADNNYEQLVGQDEEVIKNHSITDENNHTQTVLVNDLKPKNKIGRKIDW